MGVGDGIECNLSLGPYILPRLLSLKSPSHLVTELKNQSQLLVAVEDIVEPREKRVLSQAGPQVCTYYPSISPAHLGSPHHRTTQARRTPPIYTPDNVFVLQLLEEADFPKGRTRHSLHIGGGQVRHRHTPPSLGPQPLPGPNAPVLPHHHHPASPVSEPRSHESPVFWP